METQSKTTARLIMLDYLEALKWIEQQQHIELDVKDLQSNFPRQRTAGYQGDEPQMPEELRRARWIISETVVWLDANVGDGEFFLEIAIHQTRHLTLKGFKLGEITAKASMRRLPRRQQQRRDRREEERLTDLLGCALAMWNAALCSVARNAG